MDSALWRDLFHSDVSILEKILRPILVYLFLIISLRLAGKRELAQLNPFDLVVLLTLSNTVQNAIIGNDNSVLGGIIGATTLLLVNYVVVRFLYSHEALDRLVEGDADLLMEDGELKHDSIKKGTDHRHGIGGGRPQAGFLLARRDRTRGPRARRHTDVRGQKASETRDPVSGSAPPPRSHRPGCRGPETLTAVIRVDIKKAGPSDPLKL